MKILKSQQTGTNCTVILQICSTWLAIQVLKWFSPLSIWEVQAMTMVCHCVSMPVLVILTVAAGIIRYLLSTWWICTNTKMDARLIGTNCFLVIRQITRFVNEYSDAQSMMPVPKFWTDRSKRIKYWRCGTSAIRVWWLRLLLLILLIWDGIVMRSV